MTSSKLATSCYYITSKATFHEVLRIVFEIIRRWPLPSLDVVSETAGRWRGIRRTYDFLILNTQKLIDPIGTIWQTCNIEILKKQGLSIKLQTAAKRAGRSGSASHGKYSPQLKVTALKDIY